MKKILLSIAFVAVLFAACEKEPQYQVNDVVTDIVYDESTTSVPVMFLDPASVPEYLLKALQQRFTGVASSADDAKVLFVTSKGLAANKAAIAKAWRDGRIVVEIQPDNALHSDFWHSIGGVSYLDPTQTGNDLLLLAVSGMACYQLQDPLGVDVFASNIVSSEEKSPDSEASERGEDNYNAVPVPVGQSAEFLVTKLNSLVLWCHNQSVNFTGTGSEVPAFDGDLSSRILDQQYSQHITKTVAVGADNFEICKVFLSDPDKVSRHSQVDIDIYITPVYSYELNGKDKSGDYYFVTMSVLSHNKPLYGLYKQWHGAVRTWSHIFYSKSINWTATMMDSDHYPLGNRVSFFETPKPESTASGRTYTKGFSTALNVSGQGGMSAGRLTWQINVGLNFTWSNSETRTVQDQSVEMSTGINDRSVHFDYITNNLREEDSTDDAVPAIGRNDQKCEGSWCWRVSGTEDDDNDTKFSFKLEFDPIYGYMWRHATWTCEGEEKTAHLLASKERVMYFEVMNPDRARNGVFEFKSTNSNYMTGVKIKNTSGVTIAESDKAMERNSIQRFQLPVGTYSVEYQIQDGDTAEVLGSYRITGLEITTAETTVKSSLDGKPII